MVDVPAAALFAIPVDFITATDGSDELQVTWLVIVMFGLGGVKVPIAVNCCEFPSVMLEFAGVTAIEVSVAFVTASAAVPRCPAKLAEIIVLPGAIPVATPPLLEPFPTVAAEGDEEVQFTVDVRSSGVPSANIPVATNGNSIVSGTLTDGGVI